MNTKNFRMTSRIKLEWMLIRACIGLVLVTAPSLSFAQDATAQSGIFSEGVVVDPPSQTELAEIHRYGNGQRTILNAALEESTIEHPFSSKLRAQDLYDVISEVVPESLDLEKRNTLFLRIALNQGRHLYEVARAGHSLGNTQEAILLSAYNLARDYYQTDLEFLTSGIQLESHFAKYALALVSNAHPYLLGSARPNSNRLQVRLALTVFQFALNVLQSKGNLKRNYYASTIDQLSRAVQVLGPESKFKNNRRKIVYLKKVYPSVILLLEKRLRELKEGSLNKESGNE